MTRRRSLQSGVTALIGLAACASPNLLPPADVTFDTVVVWVRQGADSARAVVELAASRPQHEVGLAGRTTLDPESGMLFLFDATREPDEGFWMWRTPVQLDIGFIGSDGVIHGIREMEPCTARSQDDCPRYFAAAPYSAALEMSGGWFARHGVRVGASVRVER